MDAQAPTPAPKRRWLRSNNLRLAFWWAVSIAIVIAGYQFVEQMIFQVESEAAREHVLETGEATEYHRIYLGDQVEQLKAEHDRRRAVEGAPPKE